MAVKRTRLNKLVETGNLTTSLVFRKEDVELLRWIEQQRGGIDFSSFIRQVLYEAKDAGGRSPPLAAGPSLADIRRVVRDELDARNLVVATSNSNGHKEVKKPPPAEEVDEQLKAKLLNMF